MNAVLAEAGLGRLPMETVVGFTGNGARRLVGRSVRALDPTADEALVDEALVSFERYYRAHCLERTRLYPGIEPVLRSLHAEGRKLAVLTNKPRAFSDEILRGLSVGDLLFRVIGGDDLPTRKPDPAGLLSLVADASCGPGGAILVGDSMVDVETAANANVDSCAVAWGGSDASTLRRAGATHFVRAPAELSAVLA